MGMTMTQKILAAHAGLPSVTAGELIEADLDLVLGNDVTTPVAIHEMEKFDKKEVFDKEKIALVMDHFILRAQSIVSASGNFPVQTKSKTSLMLEQWELNMRCFRSRDLSLQEKPVSALIPIHVHMEHLALFQPVWEARIWRQEWLQARHGLRCRLPLNLI